MQRNQPPDCQNAARLSKAFAPDVKRVNGGGWPPSQGGEAQDNHAAFTG